jgi:OmpA-OmpF porin, OOP family
MSNGKKLVLASWLLLCGWLTAQAQDSGPYIGAGIGGSQIDVKEGPFFQSQDDWVGSWSLTAGYRLNSWFAVEAGYTDLGTATLRSDMSQPNVFDVSTKLKVDGYTAAAVAFLPLSSAFDLHGRVGVLLWDSDAKIRFPDAGFRQTTSSSGDDLFYGIGLGWHATENWSLSLDYQRYQDVGGDPLLGERDIDSVGIHAFYKF